MAETIDETVLDKLRNLGKGVCLIEVGRYEGTGFHFGSGWIMSVAHNFKATNDRDSFHSQVNSAEFTFPNNGGENRPFRTADNIRRMAFIHHLKFGDDNDIDQDNKDIAMVKLGVQHEYRRPQKEYKDWEKQEKSLLEKMNLPYFASINNITAPTPIKDDKVYSIHYGGDDPDDPVIQFNQHRVTNVKEMSGGIPIIELKPTLPPGASGCPILDNQCRLVGLFIGGGEYEDPNAADIALKSEGGIVPYVHKSGLEIIVAAGAYMWQQTEDNRAPLEKIAKENSLTIYLPNEEIINME